MLYMSLMLSFYTLAVKDVRETQYSEKFLCYVVLLFSVLSHLYFMWRSEIEFSVQLIVL